MKNLEKERRKFKRVVFTVEDGIVGEFNPPGNGEKPVKAKVMDISQGGLKLIFRPVLKNKIREGDRIMLSAIKGGPSSQVIFNIDTEVKWITEDELSERIGLGVEFMNVLDDERQQINDMVEFWYLQKL
jgi:c-di-GMP-binding flagellar brake protein YcgR